MLNLTILYWQFLFSLSFSRCVHCVRLFEASCCEKLCRPWMVYSYNDLDHNTCSFIFILLRFSLSFHFFYRFVDGVVVLFWWRDVYLISDESKGTHKHKKKSEKIIKTETNIKSNVKLLLPYPWRAVIIIYHLYWSLIYIFHSFYFNFLLSFFRCCSNSSLKTGN